MEPSDLHVISVISNPQQFRSRVRLFREYLERMYAQGVHVWVVEATLPQHEPQIVHPGMARGIHVKCNDVLWLKENLINIGARHLPDDAKYVMWADGDIEFDNPNWVEETIAALQVHPVIQPFSHIIDLGPDGEAIETHKSFAFCHSQGSKLGRKNRLGGWLNGYGGPYWHPGYATAFRMDVWNELGGLIDRAICGAGDYHMACAMIRKGFYSHPNVIHENYKHMVATWQKRATKAVGGDIGYVPGTVRHHYHGSKKDRRYRERWQVLIANDYDPYVDVYYDRNGVLRLAHPHGNRALQLKQELMDYFASRNEDD
jgi:hypothetical protein